MIIEPDLMSYPFHYDLKSGSMETVFISDLVFHFKIAKRYISNIYFMLYKTKVSTPAESEGH